MANCMTAVRSREDTSKVRTNSRVVADAHIALTDGEKIGPPARSELIPRTMAPSAALDVVFDTTELLERILLQLEPTQIFAVQRVSQRFLALLASSPKLRERCWLQHPKQAAGTDLAHWTTEKDPSCWAHDRADADKSASPVPIEINPLLHVRSTKCVYAWNLYPRGRDCFKIYGPSNITLLSNGPKISLQDTYITYPPCKKLEVWSLHGELCASPPFHLQLARPEFLQVAGDTTLGTFVEQVLKAKGWGGPRLAYFEFGDLEPWELTLEQIRAVVAPGAEYKIMLDTLEVDPAGSTEFSRR